MPESLNQPDLTRDLRVGMRVVLRHRIAEGLTDALGEVTSADAHALVVQTRRGAVTVPRRAVVAAKEVPPAPVRRGAPHLAPSMADLQELMVAGMPPLRSSWLGRWLLRESAAYTGRANSVLPLGDPGMELSAALSSVAGWYAARRQTPLLQVYGPDGFDVPSDALGGAALEVGWTAFQRTLVLTASVDALAAGRGSDAVGALATGRGSDGVHVDPHPGEGWWSGAAPREQDHRVTASAIFDLVPGAEYLTVTAGSDVAAVGRVAYAQAWAGVFSVHVTPTYRRRGLARAVMAVAAQRAQARGIRSMYLQVSRGNTAAVQLYEALGFTIHHEYWYLHAPLDTHHGSASPERHTST